MRDGDHIEAPRILAFDPGRQTGWASNTIHGCGTIDARGLMARDEAEALWSIKQQAYDLMMRVRPHVVVIERPMGRLVASEWPMAVTRIIHMAAWGQRIRRSEIPASSWRKIVVGRANKVKDAEVAAIAELHGMYPKNEHEADACGLVIAEDLIMRELRRA